MINFKIMKLGVLIVASFFFGLTSNKVIAAPLNWAPMPLNINPIVNESDGKVTFDNEWKFANWAKNDQRNGTYYAQWQQDWEATSSLLNQKVYPGVTLFDLNNLDGSITEDLADYNVFEYTLGTTTIKAWIFANDDDPNDAGWIGNSGLGFNNIDDRGFLVRLNNNPATDVHWFPGDPEPGDVGFNWTNYYGFFGTSGFNNSAFMMGLPGAIDGTNEVYEVALYGNAFGGDGVEFKPCITNIYRAVKDPKAGEPSQVLVDIKIGPGHINVVPEPSTLLLLGSGLAGLFGLGRRRFFKKF